MDTQATAPGDDATAAVHGEAVELAAPTDASPVALAEAAVQTELVFARIHGEPLTRLPQDLYIPPDALEVFLESFEGPLDLLLYLIRRQNFNILDIPLAEVTRQYLAYIEEIRRHNLELAAEYLLMAALLIDIKSRMLLPVRKADTGEEVEDPRAELARRLLEYERMKAAAQAIDALPMAERDFALVRVRFDRVSTRCRRRGATSCARRCCSSSRSSCGCPRSAWSTCAAPGPTCCVARSWSSITGSPARSCRSAST